MEFLLAKPVVVAMALIGAVLSTAASFLQRRGRLDERRANALNYAGYAFMGASMLLFALAGMRGVPG
jgi:hypothetical protein